MEVLKMLEEKIVSLVDLIKELKTENARLAEENAQLQAKLATLERSVDNGTQRIGELSQEKTLTKLAVDDLIKSIDSLVATEKSMVNVKQ